MRQVATACLLSLVVAFVAGCARPMPGAPVLLQRGAPDPLGAEVESYERADTAPLNTAIEEGIAAGASWPTSPLAATLELFGGDVDTRSVLLTEQKNRTEGADTTVVVMLRDGFLDDSVRGDWHRVVYIRQPDQTWRIGEVRRAFRCWRGHHLTSLSATWCP